MFESLFSQLIPDSQQSNVTSLHTYNGQAYITLATPSGTGLVTVSAINNPSPTNSPSQTNFPYGFFYFTVNGVTSGGATTVILYLPSGATIILTAAAAFFISSLFCR